MGYALLDQGRYPQVHPLGKLLRSKVAHKYHRLTADIGQRAISAMAPTAPNFGRCLLMVSGVQGLLGSQ
jgi:hypothetical protein